MSKQAFEKAHCYLSQKRAEMTAFSDYLAAHPELSQEEYESSRLMAEKLISAGFTVEYPYLRAKKTCGRNYGGVRRAAGNRPRLRA